MRYSELNELLREEGDGTFVGARLSQTSNRNLVKWLAKNNIPNAVKSDHLHITIIHSEKTFPHETKPINATVDPASYQFHVWGENNDTLVLAFKSPELSKRHEAGLKKHDLSWDFDEYIPHITLSHELTNDFRVEELEVPKFPLKITNEYVDAFESDWKEENIEEAVGVGIITKQNTTVDVKPGETARQAAKFGNKLQRDGTPPSIRDSHKRIGK